MSYELVENLESDVDLPDDIIIFPPEDANNDNTDEDSGDEDHVVINNLPGGQLRAVAEIVNSPTSDNDESSYDSDDNLPLSVITNKRKNKAPIVAETKKVRKMFSWEERDILAQEITWPLMYGPKYELSAVDTFFLFFDNEVIDMLVKFSNLYASSHNEDITISSNEMRCFLGVLLLSGYVCLPRREMYWENCNDTNNKLVCEAISRNRFRYIMKNVHCNDNTKLQHSDKFSKIRPLVNIMNKKFIEYAPHEEVHSVDESMVPYFGRHGSKQFIRGKPIRWGYKVWTGATRLGYIEWFDPYQGSSGSLPPQYKSIGLGASIVLTFADVLVEKNPLPYDIYFDNFFTSLHLLEELKSRGCRGSGTIRENRMGKDCPILHSSKIKKKERGFFVHSCTKDNEIVACKWHDNNIVSIVSNNLTVLPTIPVKRFSQKDKKHINVPQPNIIKKYNENMGGVDRADENISLYRISIRGKKWYFPLIAHIIDMAEQNAWQLHRINGGKLDHLGFRREVAVGILESFKKQTKRGPSRLPKNMHNYSRYDGMDHLVGYQDHQSRCAECHKKCNFVCMKCQIGLHPKNCFVKYHTNE